MFCKICLLHVDFYHQIRGAESESEPESESPGVVAATQESKSESIK